MKLIDRYIGRQITTATFMGVVVLTVLLVMGMMFQKILRQLDKFDIEIGFIAEFLVSVIPFTLALTIPWAFLTAILLIFGRLSADNELISLRMSGLSMPRICLSVGVLAVFFTGICGYIKLRVEPDARAKLERMIPEMLFNLASEDPMALFSDRQVMNEIPGFLIFAERKEGVERLQNFQMIVMDRFDRPEIFVTADEVEVSIDEDSEETAMLMDLIDAYFEAKPEDGEFVNTQPYAAMEAPFPISLETLRMQDEKVKPETLRVPVILDRLEQEGIDKRERSSLKTEISMRLSFSLACITLGLIGIPLGITAQRRETSVGFALSLAIGVVYFLLMTIIEMVRENYAIRPYYLAFLPNLLFIGLGIWLFWRLSRK